MAVQRSILPTLNGGPVTLGDGVPRDRHILIEAGTYTPPVFLRVYPSGTLYPVLTLPFYVQANASSLEVLSTGAIAVGRDHEYRWNIGDPAGVGAAIAPNTSGISRWTDAEYATIRASNEVVIDTTGGGDYLSWADWVNAAPASFTRPVCVTFRAGQVHTVGSGIFPEDVPGTGKVILSTDGAIPSQSSMIVPSNTNRIYPSHKGLCAQFFNRNIGNSPAFIFRTGTSTTRRDLWFRGLHVEQPDGITNSRGMWDMPYQTSLANLPDQCQWDRVILKGQSVLNPEETRKPMFWNGKNLGMFDSYCYSFAPSAGSASEGLGGPYVVQGGPYLLWNNHHEGVSHAGGFSGGVPNQPPASDMIPRDYDQQYCHLYKPASWHTAGLPAYRPKTANECKGVERWRIKNCLAENGLAAIDGQPAFNIKNAPSSHSLGAAYVTTDAIIENVWILRYRELTSILGANNGGVHRVGWKNVVAEQMGNDAGFGTSNYFQFSVLPALPQGAMSPSSLYVEGVTMSGTSNWWLWFSKQVPITGMSYRNSIIPQGVFGPFSTTQGGDGAIGNEIAADFDGVSLILIGQNPNNYDDVPGMFAGSTFPSDETGLYVDKPNGNFTIQGGHASKGTGTGAYSDPGCDIAAIESAIGRRGVNVRSLEVTP